MKSANKNTPDDYQPTWFTSVLTLTLFVFLPLMVPLRAVAQDAPPTLDQRFIIGLRERGLLELADAACRRQLVDSQQDTDVWVAELLRVLAERAMNAEPQDRDALWRDAEKLGDQFLRNNEKHPRAIMIRIQLAMNHFARGENLRIQSELMAAADIAPALAALADADRAFDKIDEQLQVLIGRAGTRRTGELTRDDLFALQNQVVYDRARIAQQRGLCYESGSADRAAAMGEAIEYLQKGLKRLDPNAPLTYQMRIERATCYRELDDLKTAEQVLAPILKLPVDDSLIPLLRCEQIRLAIARGNATTVQRSLADQDSRLHGSVQWELARLEGAVFLWQSNKTNPRIAQRWRNDALSILAKIETQYGGYWARRANRTLINSATGSADVAVLQRSADEFYLRGQLDEAIAAYDKAALAAIDSQDDEGRFLSMYRAARVVQQKDEPVSFRERLRKLTTELPNHPNCDDVHLVLIRELASAARLDRAALKEYGPALETHLQRWPNENTTDQIRIWSGIWAASQGNDEVAITVYRAVDPKSEFFADAVDGLREIWLRRLKTVPEELNNALEFLGVAMAVASEDTSEEGARLQSLVAWSGTQICLRYGESQVETWQPKLAAAFAKNKDVRLRARMLPSHIAAMSDVGKIDDANSLIESESDGELLLQVASQLADLLKRRASAENATSIGQTLSQTIKKLRNMPGTEATAMLANWEATAADVAGDEATAIKIYEQLLDKTPRDVAVRQKLARLFTRSKDRNRNEEAMNQWREVARGFPSGHDDWFEARLEVARLYILLDQKAEGVKRVRYLLFTAKPKEPWKSRFEALLK
jgi:tetratricopeptide (TPR) repeat protein